MYICMFPNNINSKKHFFLDDSSKSDKIAVVCFMKLITDVSNKFLSPSVYDGQTGQM